MKPITTFFLLFAILGLISYSVKGQSADERAVNVAHQTYAQLLAEKEQLKGFMQSQEKFDKDLCDTILQGRQQLSDIDLSLSIRTTSLALTSDANITDAKVISTMQGDLDKLVQAYQTGQTSLATQQTQLNASFKQIAALDQQYAALEQSLVRLSQPRKFRDQVTGLSDFIVAAAKAYEKLEKNKPIK